MRFGLALSLVMVGFAVVGVFIFIPFVCAYAFWIVVAAFALLAAGWGRLIKVAIFFLDAFGGHHSAASLRPAHGLHHLWNHRRIRPAKLAGAAKGGECWRRDR